MKKRMWRIAKAIAVLSAFVVILALIVFIDALHFRSASHYQNGDAGKTSLYANRNVMVFVPHQDDEINVMGGAIEEYVRYGSEVRIVFMTNGDYRGLAEIRFQEAISVAEAMGIPRENVIFLGYGDQWASGGPHIYNAEPNAVLTSYLGKTQTYGTSAKHAYREGRDYTLANLTRDITDVILEHRPDVLYCVDYDSHTDHKALSLLFEKTMGSILKSDETYRPSVFKAYAYQSAWFAPDDFYAENILSTQNVFAHGQKPEIYHWEERVRLPVAENMLSRSLLGSQAYKTIALYASQIAETRASRIVNGDKVCWHRPTTSLCLDAEIVVSSGDASVLNDFMLMDNPDIVRKDVQTYSGVWMTSPQDTQKTASVVFEQEHDVESIVLYDHPSEEENVLNAAICFDDGTRIETGALHPGGAQTVIPVKKKNVRSFEVTLVQTMGKQAGLTEIEAYEKTPDCGMTYIKLMDENGNFAYDYLTKSDDWVAFSVYQQGVLPEFNDENYTLTVDGKDCSAVIEEGVIYVNCPWKRSCKVTVASRENPAVSDTVTVRNPRWLARKRLALWQQVERRIYQYICDRAS